MSHSSPLAHSGVLSGQEWTLLLGTSKCCDLEEERKEGVDGWNLEEERKEGVDGWNLEEERKAGIDDCNLEERKDGFNGEINFEKGVVVMVGHLTLLVVRVAGLVLPVTVLRLACSGFDPPRSQLFFCFLNQIST